MPTTVGACATRAESGAGDGRDGRAAEAWATRRSDPLRALELAEALRDEAVAAGDDGARGRALTTIGACHIARNDYTAALSALLEALAVLGDDLPADRAQALSESGRLDTMLGDHAGALSRLLGALSLHERLGDVAGQASDLNRIGITFYNHGDLTEAADAYTRSLELSLEVGDDLAASGVRNNLAKVATARGDHDAALAHLTEARDGFARAGERRGLGMTLQNAAAVREARGDRERAVDWYRASIVEYEAAGHTHGACEARTELAPLLADGGDDTEAEAMLLRAHADAESLGLDRECVRTSEALADLLEARGDDAGALRWLRHLRGVERHLFDATSEQRLRSLQVRFQLDRLARDSVTDVLTGLANRRGLDQALDDAIARARRDRADLALLLFDLDDFKRVNDRHSHSVGDEVLRGIADVLRSTTRPTDVCARYGGEEFVVLVPGCDLAQATEVAQDLRRAVRRHDWAAIVDDLAVTTSIGVAVLSDVADAHDLLAAADRALYAAKFGGKDRVRAHG